MQAVGKCVAGLLRKNNEDAIYISDGKSGPENLYVVADGMGGHNAGEIASNGAIEAFSEYLNQNKNKLLNKEEILDVLVEGVQYSNAVIYEQASSHQECLGMGTTFITAIVFHERLYATHVGDSRLYIFRNGHLEQLTKDHSYVMEMVKMGKLTLEEASVHPKRNIITRALGTSDKLDIDTIVEDLQSQDIILLCTDGLSTMVPKEDMEQILSMNLSLTQKVDMLIEKANLNGGKDNISVILIQ